MFIDQVKVYIKAGDGGDGCVSFRREKFVPFGGPDGGDGGKGGDVIFEASHQLSTLIDLRYQQHYLLKHAGHGKGHNASGKGSPDRIIPVPTGTLVREIETEILLADLVSHGQRFVAARGGRGGRGNAHFRSPTHQTPSEAEPGEAGEEFWLFLELKLLAEVGLVGLPNAGKSSMMSAVTKAHPKVGSYPFTTLEPNLGVATWKESKGSASHVTLADVPGLIEGAHKGKGLGLKFLKHLERTIVLLHLVDVSEMAPGDPVDDFGIIRGEIEQYHPEMFNKPFVVAGTKVDISGDKKKLGELRSHCNKKEIPFFEISSATGFGTKTLIRSLGYAVEKHRNSPQKPFDVLF